MLSGKAFPASSILGFFNKMYNSSNSFYITLPSNVTYPTGNKANHFITHLATELDLKGKWECGLSEITYNRNWKFCDKTIETKFVMLTPNTQSPSGYDTQTFKIELPPTIYPTPTYFLKELWNKFQGAHVLNSAPGLKSIIDATTLNINDGIAQIKCTMNDVSIIFPEYISAMLGLDSKILTFSNSTIKWVLPSSMVNTTSLYIYCDAIEDVMVGDVRAKLLRTVPVTGEHSGYVTASFTKIYYHPVRLGYISSIEVKICDDTGEKIMFGTTKTVVVLHFRKSDIEL